MADSEVFLRAVQPSDATLMLTWENNEEYWNVSNTTEAYTRSEIIALIESLEDIEQAKQARWIICHQSTNKAIGAIDLFNINFEEESAEIGILIATPENRRKGFAAASIALLEQICRDELGLYHLKAKVQATNRGSLKLFQKCGFQKKDLPKVSQLNNADYIESIFFEKWVKESD